jgi:hypothetical protein
MLGGRVVSATPWERDVVPILQDAGWALVLVWMGKENLGPTRV